MALCESCVEAVRAPLLRAGAGPGALPPLRSLSALWRLRPRRLSAHLLAAAVGFAKEGRAASFEARLMARAGFN